MLVSDIIFKSVFIYSLSGYKRQMINITSRHINHKNWRFNEKGAFKDIVIPQGPENDTTI